VPATSKVSVPWSIVFTSIPIVNFWTFYRITKLRRCLVYAFVPFVAVSFISNTVFFSFGL